MLATDEIRISDNIKLRVDIEETDHNICIHLQMKNSEPCILHWGLSHKVSNIWKLPPESSWPDSSTAFADTAVQTPFLVKDGESHINMNVDKTDNVRVINFALYYPESDKWDNNFGRNYFIKLPAKDTLVDTGELLEKTLSGEVLLKERFDIDDEGIMSVAVTRKGDSFSITFITDIAGQLLLHWGGAFKNPFEWRLPPKNICPAGTMAYDDRAVQTAFEWADKVNRLTLQFSEDAAPLGIHFVLTFADEQRWLNNRGQNIHIPVAGLLKKNAYKGSTDNARAAMEIVQAETGRNSWTLMHRFNLCHDLLDRVSRDEEGLALIFVWMRYSYIRQLDWQRNYNTKPRELSHAQDRLTLKLAEMFIHDHDRREMVTLIMSSLGRGGEGQRIRDEILQIMHRHHIKEVAGSFMEEWHQKLHNNTTPDDIVICQAYLEFLRSDGQLDLFYSTLEAGGVTKERLESFERPIVTHPDFIPHLKDALIYDFDNYLKLLKSVHSGTDLESAADAAAYLMDYEMRDHLDLIFSSRHDPSVHVMKVMGSITRLRKVLHDILRNDKDKYRIRELIYLDLALEEYLRIVVERNIQDNDDTGELVELTGCVLENQIFSYRNFELSACSAHWSRLKSVQKREQDWALHAKAVLDRLGRAIADLSDRYYRLLQGNAQYLGEAFYAEQWTINLFSEEIVRGRLSFILSMLIHHLDPMLRKHADLGDWQVISPGQAQGVVEVVQSLRSVQDRKFDKPTIIIADNVHGDEEPPAGLRAVITPDLVDLVAHVAIRARNSGILFATCYNREKFESLKLKAGQNVSLRVNPGGDVEPYVSGGDNGGESPAPVLKVRQLKAPPESGYVIKSSDYNDDLVGGKSLNLIRLMNKLPEWIHLPSSVAIPFGVAEKVLKLDINKGVAKKIDALLGTVRDHAADSLSDVRNSFLSLTEPAELVSSLRIAMEESGLGWHENWEDLWLCIKKVWASKWNDRAFVSRNKQGMSHDNLYMAVLIQQVIKAEYAFVIHTSHPVTGSADELYAEVVPGLGETLVGNYPGKALGFSSRKDGTAPRVICYPSKSLALTGKGLIFRSDSNGEDLAEFAGAGLYDSVMVELPRALPINYVDEPLMWNENFRNNMLSAITNIGLTIEQAMGSPQDIEGAYAGGKYYVVQTRPQI